MTSASPFLTAHGQATSSLNKPSHPFIGSGIGWDVVDNVFPFCPFSFIFYFFNLISSPLLQGTAKHVTALSFTEMIPSCQNVLEEVHLSMSLSPKAVSEHGLLLCDPSQSGGVLRALWRRNFLAQLSAMKVNR